LLKKLKKKNSEINFQKEKKILHKYKYEAINIASILENRSEVFKKEKKPIFL